MPGNENSVKATLWNPGTGMDVLKLHILFISHVKPKNSLKVNARQWSTSWIKATAKVSPGVVLQKNAVGRGAGSAQGLLNLPREQLSEVPNLRLDPGLPTKLSLWKFPGLSIFPFQHQPFMDLSVLCRLPCSCPSIFSNCYQTSKRRSSPFSPEVSGVHPTHF